MLAYSSPWLFAVNRVLHRLLMPRHSPYALISLIFSRIGSNNLSRLHEFSFSLHPLKLQQSDITTLLLSFDLMFFLFLREFTSLCSFQGTLVGSSGLEPPTSRLSGVRSNQLSYEPFGGDDRVRTGGLLLARQALYQLSYTPTQVCLLRCKDASAPSKLYSAFSLIYAFFPKQLFF